MSYWKVGDVVTERSMPDDPFIVVEHRPSYYSQEDYIIRSLFSGWTCYAHGVTLFPDGYSWDFTDDLGYTEG